MQINLNTSSKTFQYTFTISLLVFAVVLFAAATYSWTGPTGAPPNSNVAAPINTGSTSQVKSGALSVNGLSVYGNGYLSGHLGIGSSPSAPWRIYAPGSSYGIYAEATNGQAIRGATTAGGYAGYFVGGAGGGGVYAQNSGGYYAFLGYPGDVWSVYANGPTYTGSYSRADGGFCIGGSCKTSWGAMGSSYWTGWATIGSGNHTVSCASGYVVTAVGTQLLSNTTSQIRILCTNLNP